MEASERHQLALDRKAPRGAQSPRQVRLIDPGAIDYDSPRGVTRLGLMLGPVLDRLTAVEMSPGADA
jgi:hypothetical protein